ncbi:MAG: Ig-like domain-containing protein [Bacteroidales bacterium]|nr:Ig-like domain-containing protein [Bacteroidales bacterium]
MFRYFNIIFGFIGIVIFLACATPGRPGGGPRDETPPVPLHFSPANFSTNFNARTIRVQFDENIQLRNLNQQLIISPPMARPTIVSNNRNLTISLQDTDTLREHTTYVFSFGNALADRNEGNVLSNFQIVFSTGETIDSLSILGEVLDAFTLEPITDVSIALVADLDDMFVREIRPLFIARTGESGFFQVNFLTYDCFYLVAINDRNNDWVYDSISEEIAFFSTCVLSRFLERPVFPDTTISEADSLKLLDSIAQFLQSGHRLLMFRQELPQGITGSEFTSNAEIAIEFRNPTEHAAFRILQPDPDSIPLNFSIIWNNSRQNAQIFLSELSVRNLWFEIEDGEFIDTLRMLNTRFQDEPPPLRVALPFGSEMPFFDSLRLAFNMPIREVTDTIWLFEGDDTIPTPLTNFSFNETRTQLIFEKELQQRTNYRILIPDSLIFADFGQTNNDTLNLRFRVNSPEAYARLEITIHNKTSDVPHLLQVLNERMELVEQRVMESNEEIFTTLRPGSYRLRLIVDEDGNGRWSPGNLRERRQPEPVFIFHKTLSLQAGWEFIEEWKLPFSSLQESP